MAQRKDLMRIIRQDAGFSAKLGFGGNVSASDQAGRVIPVQSMSVDAVTEPFSSRWTRPSDRRGRDVARVKLVILVPPCVVRTSGD